MIEFDTKLQEKYFNIKVIFFDTSLAYIKMIADIYTRNQKQNTMQRDPRLEQDFPTPTEAGFTMELDINETPVEADVTFCYIEVDGKAVVETSEIEIESWVSSDMTRWLPQVQDQIDDYLFPKEVIYK